MMKLHCACLLPVLLSLLLRTGSAMLQVPDYIHDIFPGYSAHFRVVPSDQIVTAGDSYALFHCLPGSAGGLKVEWKIFSPDGEAIVGDRHEVSEDGTRLKIIEPMEFYDNFEIHCYLISPFHPVPLKAVAKLYVRPPKHPKIVVAPRSGKYKSGSRIVLECAAHGWPLPRIGWMFISRRHRTKKFFEFDHEYRDYIKEPNRLIILNMNPDNEGTYTCLAVNKVGHDKVTAHVGFDRRGVHQSNLHQIMDQMRKVHSRLYYYGKECEHKLRSKAKCNLEVGSQLGYLEHGSRTLDGMTQTYDYLVAQLEAEQHSQLNSLPGEALNINIKMLQYIKASLNCSTTAVPEPDCHTFADYLMRYQALDGSCNNFKNPTWGQGGRGFRRYLQSQYELGINLPQGLQKKRLYGGFHKPSPRLVSLHVLLRKEYPVDHSISQMFNVFGQLLDHDLSQTPTASTDRGLLYNTECNKHCRNDPPCFPIIAPKDDPRVKGCLTFKRSAAFCASGEFNNHQSCIRPREQINQLTSVIDANIVYGPNCKVLNLLRDFSGPAIYLKTSPPVHGHHLRQLPFKIDGVPTACAKNSDSPNAQCYSSGDVRGNQFIMLTVQHTMLVREHNRIAHVLHSLNPKWCPDMVFYETRRIVAAVLQQISYNEYLPLLIGATGMRKMVGPYKGYKSNVNPSITNEFATAIFRIGHAMVPDFLAMLDKHYKLIKSLSLKSTLFAPHLIANYDIDPLVRGSITVAAKSRGCMPKGRGSMSNSIVNELFEKTSIPATDLGATNIQRGRDHALPSYNYWRVLCGLKWATKWEHLSTEIRDPHALKNLAEVYGSPLNVDLFAGMVLEDRVDDALVGPTARCVLAKQFKEVRDGDRHWFENPDQFTATQVQEIRRYTYSRLICNTVETINSIQPNAFFLPLQHSDLVPCSELPDMDLAAWKDPYRHPRCIPASPCGGPSAAEAGGPGPNYSP